jgi:uncharacterized paraquat-inducible protein A
MSDMAPQATRSGGDICPRCRLAIMKNAARCPHCGERLTSHKRVPLYVGIVGVIALLFVAMVMLQSIIRADRERAPTVTLDDAPSSDAGKPDKPPPLNK